jgi:pimeloyl-ACP methyl ester carboxylesterase
MNAACFLIPFVMINPERVDHFSISISNPSTTPVVYPCKIEYPAAPSDRAVVLFSGGLIADIDWSVPGTVEHQGNTIELTISLQDTRDGLTLANALLEAGFIVARYSSVPEGKTIINAQPIAFPETVELVNTFWDETLARLELEPSRVGVVGHSMGATRGVLASDGQAGGYVFLAGAYMTPTMEVPSKLAKAAIDIQSKEEGIDYDNSGEVVGWELAAENKITTNTFRTKEWLTNNGQKFNWPSDLLTKNHARVCALWGGLDHISYHAPVLEHIYSQTEGHQSTDLIETIYFPALGHQLCEEVDGKIGPIDSDVVQEVVRWLDRSIVHED